MNEKDLTHIDLFSGIGGFALAAGWAGFKTVAFCEIEPFCREVLKKHWPGVPMFHDIMKLTGAIIWEELAQNANREKSPLADLTANRATQKELRYGGKTIGGDIQNTQESGTEKRRRKSSPTMGGNALVAEKKQSNFSPSTISSTMAIQSEKSISPRLGNSSLKEGSQTIIKSSATTATMPDPIMEPVPISGRIQIDLLTAGVPCQPASVAGKRRGKEDDRWLWGARKRQNEFNSRRT